MNPHGLISKGSTRRGRYYPDVVLNMLFSGLVRSIGDVLLTAGHHVNDLQPPRAFGIL